MHLPCRQGLLCESFYNTVKTVYAGETFIPLNPRGTKDSKVLSAGNPICEAGLAMHKDGKTTDNGHTARNTAAHSVNPKQARVSAVTRIGTTGRKTGVARNTRPLPMTTDSPWTAVVSILIEPMLCRQSVSATIPVSNPQGRSGCGCGAAQAWRTSTHWLISLPWLLL